VRVLLADHHVLVRHGIKALLERQGCQVVGETADGPAAVEMARKVRPDVVLLDALLPQLNGLEAARAIARVTPATRVILLASPGQEDLVLDAFQDGARGFVLKTQSVEDLLQAIRDVARGGIYVGPGPSKAILEACRAVRVFARDPLSPREGQVLRLVAEGKSTKQLAALLKISVKTADYHRTRLMKKLNLHDSVGLARYAIRHGIIAP
jgi:two-component system, NarL family, response regulator NreC